MNTSNMGTNNNNNQSLQEQINRLAHQLDKERSTINQLRSSIDVLHSGWSQDKERLTEAEEKLNEKDKPKIKKEKVDAEEIKMPRESSSCKRRMTTRSVGYKKVCKDGTSINDESILNGLIPCPLCCTETFLNEEGLKRHLYHYMESVICPMCSQNYENIGCLINHLEIGCESSILYTSSCTKKQIDAANCSDSGQPFNLSKSTLAIVSFKMPEANIDQSALDGIQIMEETAVPKTIPSKINSPERKTNAISQKPTAVKQEPLNQYVDSDVEDVTEEKAVIDISDNDSVINNDDNDYSDDAAVEDEGDTAKEKDEYLCSACNISFTSIIDHIKQYHFGEEVKIEGAPEKLKQKLLSCGKVVSSNGEGSKCALQQQNASADDSLFGSNKKQNEETNSRDAKVTGYWAKRESYYNFVSNEDKMRLLYPNFKPPKTKITTSVDNNASIKGKHRTKKLLENLDLVQMVDDKMLLGGASYSHISVYIVDEMKARDKTKFGPVAKPISNLHRSKFKIESDDESEEFNKSDKKLSDESMLKKRSGQYVLLLKVPLGKDKEITIENVNFGFLPTVSENIVPYLENITNPEIPLLKGAKRLKWQCSLCLTRLSSYFVASKRHNCYKCQYCGAGFRKNISVFMKHLLSCAKNKANAAKPFACSCCPSFFKTMEEARSHMPLHMAGSRAVQCSLCYALFRDKIILNNHLMYEHDTDISQLGSEVKQPRLKAKSKYNATPASQRKRSGSNKKIKCELDSPYVSNYKQSIKTEDSFSEVVIKEETVDDSTPSRSSRKRKVNKTYFDECYVY